MSRVFAYCRVSTDGQTTDNQVHEIAAAGFAIDTKRVIRETVSGSAAAPRLRQAAGPVGVGRRAGGHQAGPAGPQRT
jgi:DNA invertase Pin-like site-specific DNA recombinase